MPTWTRVREVKLFLDWKAATRHAPTTVKEYCFRLLWFYHFLAKLHLQIEEVTAAHLTEFVIWFQHLGCPYPQKVPSTYAQPLATRTINLIVQEIAGLYRFLVRRSLIAQSPVVYIAASWGTWAIERDLLARPTQCTWHLHPSGESRRLSRAHNQAVGASFFIYQFFQSCSTRLDSSRWSLDG